MYSTCLFCNGDLGTNEAIDQLPVGRRLAFDAAKGRLWVVCTLRTLALSARRAARNEDDGQRETERRALEGGLHLLAGAWHCAEEIAGIADDMILPKSVEANLDRLKRKE